MLGLVTDEGKMESGEAPEFKKTRVLHCLGWLSTGGVERLRVFLAEHTSPTEFEHLVICQRADTWIVDILTEHGWLVREIGVSHSLFNVRWHQAALRIAKEFDPDVIHGAVFEGNALAVSIGLLLGNKRVFIEETSDAKGRRLFGHVLMALLVKYSLGVVAVSPAVANYLRNRLKVPSRKIHLIVNGVQERIGLTNSERQRLRAGLGFGDTDLILGSVGRLLDSHKRFSDLIHATKALVSDFPNLRLVILGEGPDRSALEALVGKLALSKSVFFLGHMEEPRETIEALDIFALVSSGEAFGLALAEAAMAGVPCVATRVGGMPYILDYGNAGLLVGPDSPEELVVALRKLLESPDLRNVLGIRARNRAEREFSSERYAGEVVDLWKGTRATAAGPID